VNSVKRVKKKSKT